MISWHVSKKTVHCVFNWRGWECDNIHKTHKRFWKFKSAIAANYNADNEYGEKDAIVNQGAPNRGFDKWLHLRSRLTSDYTSLVIIPFGVITDRIGEVLAGEWHCGAFIRRAPDQGKVFSLDLG